MNVLVTGSNGFIGSNIIRLLNNKFNFFNGTRDSINLFSTESIKNYIRENKIDTVIHCAVEGGSRLKTDSSEVFYKNILMYENLMKFRDQYKLFINLASGAEFDRRYDINEKQEEEINNSVPIDFYGLSKNLISKLSKNNKNNINLRIFGCFYYNELHTRFIRNNITNYINKNPITIHQDKYMDFFYIEDLIQVIEYFLKNSTKNQIDMNMSYLKKYKLSHIANIINSLGNHTVDVLIQEKSEGSNYTGNGTKLSNLNLNLKGLEIGIEEIYDKYKHNILH